jgi:hypothetical protein
VGDDLVAVAVHGQQWHADLPALATAASPPSRARPGLRARLAVLAGAPAAQWLQGVPWPDDIDYHGGLAAWLVSFLGDEPEVQARLTALLPAVIYRLTQPGTGCWRNVRRDLLHGLATWHDQAADAAVALTDLLVRQGEDQQTIATIPGRIGPAATVAAPVLDELLVKAATELVGVPCHPRQAHRQLRMGPGGGRTRPVAMYRGTNTASVLPQPPSAGSARPGTDLSSGFEGPFRAVKPHDESGFAAGT